MAGQGHQQGDHAALVSQVEREIVGMDEIGFALEAVRRHHQEVR